MRVVQFCGEPGADVVDQQRYSVVGLAEQRHPRTATVRAIPARKGRPVAHRWRYESSDGTPVSGPEVDFAGAAEAEEWFGAHWEDLAADGVQQVVLLDGEDVVYGPMGLDPA